MAEIKPKTAKHTMTAILKRNKAVMGVDCESRDLYIMLGKWKVQFHWLEDDDTVRRLISCV